MPAFVSVVIPVYNGSATIGGLVETLIDHHARRYQLEIVLVDDGSADDSRTVCRNLVDEHAGIVRFLQLSRNFGEHQAVLAGLRHTRGECAVIMDDDFQNPPADVGRLVERLLEGNHDVVYSRFRSKQHSLFRNLGSWINDRMAVLMLRKPRGLYLSSFKCLNRFLIDEVCRYAGPYPYLDGLILRVTRNFGVVDCEHHARQAGESGYTLRRLLRVWLNMFTNFSILPLRAVVAIGLSFSVLGGLLSAGVVIEKILVPETQVGWASLAVLSMMFAGIQLMVLGMMGEYLGRLFLTANSTPQSVVRAVYGSSAAAEQPERIEPGRVDPDQIEDGE